MLQHKKLALLSLSLFSLIALAAKAEPIDNRHIIVAPQCLVKNLSVSMNYKTLASSSTLALLETNRLGIDYLIEAKNHRTATPCGGFVDVTDAWDNYHSRDLSSQRKAKSFLQEEMTKESSVKIKAKTYGIQYPDQVNQLIKQINPSTIWSDLTAFSDTHKSKFPDRYANSATGVNAANWLKEKIEALAKANNRTDITTYAISTGPQYKQPSIVVKIGDSNEPGVVIGGHMDTLSSSWELKPGADDDGSGSMAVMEIARTLISSNMRFKKPIYIMWYAAEEEGLVGSSKVVAEFKNKNIPIDAVLQFDMTGYADKNDPTIWLITDNINKDLTAYLETLIKTYIKQPVGYTRCGYSCSDHASWNKAGFPAAIPFEAAFGKDNPYIHTANDTINILSINHMANFAKLGIAFAVELAEPVV
ncbi:MAG: M20/M25/M40 family metallo-hydrolase [Gammaproteobacteria bacterium]|nr:M20/M25/M40 family metallo-hydrolase [Gammaproteobacteria bacterium]MCW5583605.1 M20/M25/M40 family metallo-hydrolase [Gammaproteobacteria bacterium]